MLSEKEEQTTCCFGLFTEKVWTLEEIEHSTYDNDHDVKFISEDGNNHLYDGSQMTVTSQSKRLSKERYLLHKVSYDNNFSIILIYKKDKNSKKFVLEDGTVYVDELQFKIKEQIVDKYDITYVL
jgi:hypothetical protein